MSWYITTDLAQWRLLSLLSGQHKQHRIVTAIRDGP